MAQSVFGRPVHWIEPAHPGIVTQHADLVKLYTVVRDKAQPQIDAAFDSVSRSIGFVIATTVPVAVTVDDKGAITAADVGAGQLKGTLFERELGQAFTPLVGQHSGAAAGTYTIYALWQSALALALRRDWLEPAHLAAGSQQLAATASVAATRQLPPGVREPAHFLDGRIQLTPEETAQLSAIDAVYPDLHLGERVAASRVATRPAVSPHVQEPAHFRTSDLLRNDDFVAALNQLVQKFSG